MSARLISLAAGLVLDIGPADAVDVAARAGFGAVGIRFDPQTWTASIAHDVGHRLTETGVVPLDIGAVVFGRGPDHGEAIIDIAAEIGVRHVVVASGSADPKEVVERFAALCNRAGGSAVVVVLEFLPDLLDRFTLGCPRCRGPGPGHCQRCCAGRQPAPCPVGRHAY